MQQHSPLSLIFTVKELWKNLLLGGHFQLKDSTKRESTQRNGFQGCCSTACEIGVMFRGVRHQNSGAGTWGISMGPSCNPRLFILLSLSAPFCPPSPTALVMLGQGPKSERRFLKIKQKLLRERDLNLNQNKQNKPLKTPICTKCVHFMSVVATKLGKVNKYNFCKDIKHWLRSN